MSVGENTPTPTDQVLCLSVVDIRRTPEPSQIFWIFPWAKQSFLWASRWPPLWLCQGNSLCPVWMTTSPLLSHHITSARRMVWRQQRLKRWLWTSIVDHSPLHISGTTVERVKNSKCLGVHVTQDLFWTLNTTCRAKKALQHLHFMWRLKRAPSPLLILIMFYKGTLQSVLISCPVQGSTCHFMEC